MRKIYSILTIALFAIIVSCTDDSLDPLQFKKVSKGTLLALRGDYLNAIYFDGVSGASFVPKITDGTDVFAYEGEFLSDNPSALESIDVYAEDSVGVRTLLKNYPASAFTTGENGRPLIKVSFTIAEILPKIGIAADFPLDPDVVAAILGDDPSLGNYKAGINIVTDINLTDGTKVLADDMVASGLYQSDQFYPAMRLPFDVVRYCDYADDWEGDYKGIEILSDDTNGPNDYTLTSTDPNTYHVSGVYGAEGKTSAIEFDIEFVPSTSPYDQDVSDFTATVAAGVIKGTKGSYDQCNGIITFSAALTDEDDKVTKWTYQFSKK
jgi:hypothetical protein